MTAYFLFDVREIKDPEGAKQYRDGVFRTVHQHGGRYLALGGKFDVKEGAWSPGIVVIIEFPSRERAEAWYDSDSYRPLRELRLRATDSCAILVDGFADQPSASG